MRRLSADFAENPRSNKQIDLWAAIPKFDEMHDENKKTISSNSNEADNEKRLNLLYEIGRVLASTETMKEAAPPILEAICRHLQSDIGEFWSLEENDTVLRREGFWHRSSTVSEQFTADRRPLEFADGEDLPGRVWQCGAPIWLEDLSREKSSSRCVSAERAGMRSAFGFPILLGEKFFGALCFFCKGQCRQDKELLKMFAAVGGNLCHFVKRERVEKTARASNAILETIDQSSPTLIYLKDRAGRMLNANPATLDVIGKTLAEVAGKTHGEFMQDAAEGATIAENDRRIIEYGETDTFEEKVLTKGTLHTFLSTKTPYRNELGEIIGLVGVSFDITERKSAEEALCESEQRYRTLFETMDEGFCRCEMIFDPHGKPSDYRFLEINPVFEKMSGLENAAGRTALELIPNLESHWVETYGKVIMTGEPIRFTAGSAALNRWFDVYAARIGGEKSREFSILFKDVSERRKIETERERLLESEHRARETAEQANHAKDEFIALVSHELRSPLNAMLGWTRILQNQKADEKTTHHALDVIIRNALSQSRLIEDLLDIARLDKGKLRLELAPIELAPIIENAVEITKPTAEAKNIRLSQSSERTANLITGDGDRLRQIVENLLANAVKFTPDGGSVNVRLERENAQAVIIVSDNGQGISAEFLPQIFERFKQADPSATRRHGGLGIGLSLARDLVELHGGTISAQSAGEGQGSTFTVRLPLRAVAPIKDITDKVENMDSQGKLSGFWILAVDDEADAREIISFMLQINGARVTSANSAVEALEILKNAHDRIPDILLSDISMPNESGYALLEKIRSLPREHGGEIPAVALTAFNRPEDREAAFEAGFQKHLGKPVDMDALIDAIVETANAKHA